MSTISTQWPRIHDLRTNRFTGRPFDQAAALKPGLDGALATLEGFYHGLNERDLSTLASVWAPVDQIQLNNPVGGISRGPEAIQALYSAVVSGRVRVQVAFCDAVGYATADSLTFAGREEGHYLIDGAEVPLSIRTTRCLLYLPDVGWRQVHHHGSIDDASALSAYQRAILGDASA